MAPVEPPLVKLPADLERTFEAARADVGDADRLARIQALLEPRLTSAFPTRWPFAPHVAVGALVTVGVVASLLGRSFRNIEPTTRVASPPPASAPAATRSPPAPVVETEVAPSSSQAPRESAPSPPARSLMGHTVTARAPAPTAPRVVTPVPALTTAPPLSADPVVQEHEILAAARRSLDSAPAETLVRVTEHEQRFPDGVLTSERELLRILALARLGRLPEANAARGAFVARWPTSAYRGEIDRAIDHARSTR